MKDIAKKTRKKSSKKNIAKIPEGQYREIIGIIFFIVALSLFFILLGNSGIAGEYIQNFLRSLFGIGAILIPVILTISGAFLFFVNHFKFTFHRILGLGLFFIGILTLIHLGTDFKSSFEKLKDYGGMFGFTSSFILRSLFGDFIAHIVGFGIIFISIPLIFDMSIKEMFQAIFKPLTKVREKTENVEDAEFAQSKIQDIQAIEFQETQKIKGPAVSIIKPKQIEIAEVKNISDENEKIEEAKIKKQIEEILPKEDSKPKIQMKKPASGGIKISNFTGKEKWEFPSLDLLENKVDDNYPDDTKLEKAALNIQTKLSQFGIEVDVINARVGPTVTQFTLNPAEGVKVSKILGLKDDLAMALSAKAVRIEAPIPGQPYVGIEIPNEARSIVYLREILESEEFKKGDSKLKLCFGKDISGNPVVEDLGKMPHMLIAGTTGSGKSVGMNTFLISLMYQNPPTDLKFIMIDPKMVELSGYNGIPYLLTPVITDADKALASLKWGVSEMMRRYTECKEKGYKNIQEYNENEETKMPKIVIVIDELADLMMREFKKDTETAIARIAQMARAVGMHLIIATQRPTADVLTGLIKANIPTRVSFAVKSSIDSRIVLDTMGGEDLLGMGDMMYINSSLPKPKRVQGIFISSKEIKNVVDHIKLAKEPEDEENGDFQEDITAESTQANSLSGSGGFSAPGVGAIDLDAIASASKQDEKVGEAIAVIQQTGKASATFLQRMIGVGYARAAKILDILEEQGIVGPANGAKPREVYLEKNLE
ncbi:DNA translocase FtsK 4TM domain-containing protein [Candidatus Gracilibacteria bacterium]|nr:DNA translocase FtsK 4TM domain-containing protein [Candidatus Gracilibacteria bacterium]